MPFRFVVPLCFVLAAALITAGCGSRMPVAASSDKSSGKPAKNTDAKPTGDGKKNKTNAGATDKNKTKRKTKQPKKDEDTENWLPGLGSGTFDSGNKGGSWSGGSAFADTQAIERIERELKDAISLRPTLVVWLFDQSSANKVLRTAIAAAAKDIPSRVSGNTGQNGSALAAKNKLLTAVVSYGEAVNLVTAEPVVDPTQIPAADKLGDDPGPSTQAYAAVQKAAEIAVPYRTKGHEAIVVLVAQQASADEENFDKAVAALRKVAIPVFAIGPAIPFGRVGDSFLGDRQTPTAINVSESLYPERIALFLPNNRGDEDLADSGFGPFGLERICRATDGKCLRLRSLGSAGWATEEDGDIKPELLRRYAPDYVSAEEYQKNLDGNKACQALHEAAKLPPAKVLVPPQYDFTPGNEAALARSLGNAQRAAAEAQTALARLHETLSAGVSDRSKLQSPRWQASYDLAYGRACAARARNDGYNHMLAVLKNGKAFKSKESRMWALEPADSIENNSQLERMGKDARTYLERVVKEHAGTPWAALANRELETPTGWKWVEK